MAAETVPFSGRNEDGRGFFSTRALVQETAIAFVYNGTTEAVMMATPADLEDFAIGFSLNEGLIEGLEELDALTVQPAEHGIELRLWLNSARTAAYQTRRRHLAGPTGCGLCGIESLSEAMRPLKRVAADTTVSEKEIADAVASLAALQRLHQATHAAHAAGYYCPGRGLIALREDVGRHNALDKLGGTLKRDGVDASRGLLVITSRVSVEMVQKTAVIGAPVLVAVSAPTALAVRTAAAANVTLVGVVRGDTYQVFCHGHRITDGALAQVIDGAHDHDQGSAHR
ncbi:formate dehydrogenase accessory sulfurtransferase FdhD [Pseudolabrys taiwanensis]|uniref:Sulfur carrier protein FdhD n=2 Tax=Pseudolabrys taiwanensis TaxID=331696 RepID=A0A346A4K4_9HYPH|nr:formate dehydrogenase accessory sulfurtransferase FdhD [Pseudolabrys taiwanensis]